VITKILVIFLLKYPPRCTICLSTFLLGNYIRITVAMFSVALLDTFNSSGCNLFLLLSLGMLCHVNVIPLNPTVGYGGKPTAKAGVDQFIEILVNISNEIY